MAPRHEELVYTYLSFTAILANLIRVALCLRTDFVNYLLTLTESLTGRKYSGACFIWLRKGLRIEKSLFGIVLPHEYFFFFLALMFFLGFCAGLQHGKGVELLISNRLSLTSLLAC